MKQMKIVWRVSLIMIVLILLHGQSALAQSNRVPPIQIDEWFANRVWYIAAAGAISGFLIANFWLPLFSAVPHQDDNTMARRQFYIALTVSIILVAGYLLIDASFIYRFGRQTYTFWEAFLQVWLTWQTFVMLLIAAMALTLVVALWTVS